MPRTKLSLAPVSNATAALDLKAGQTSKVPVTDIKLRKDGDTRPLNARHVVGLAENISVVDLLQPIVVDSAGHLLAGGHRLAALQLLAVKDGTERRAEFLKRAGVTKKEPETPELKEMADRIEALNVTGFNSSVRVSVFDVSGSKQSERALEIEASENTVRRSYTKEEIIELAARFKKAGYTQRSGKPAKGEKTVMNALETTMGVSKRQIQYIISGGQPKVKSPWGRAKGSFLRAAQRIVDVGEKREGEEDVALVKVAKSVLKQVEKKS